MFKLKGKALSLAFLAVSSLVFSSCSNKNEAEQKEKTPFLEWVEYTPKTGNQFNCREFQDMVLRGTSKRIVMVGFHANSIENMDSELQLLGLVIHDKTQQNILIIKVDMNKYQVTADNFPSIRKQKTPEFHLYMEDQTGKAEFFNAFMGYGQEGNKKWNSEHFFQEVLKPVLKNYESNRTFFNGQPVYTTFECR